MEKYDLKNQELEAIDFMLQELDLCIPSKNPLRSQIELIGAVFYKTGDLPDKHKKSLVRLYERFTDVQYNRYDN